MASTTIVISSEDSTIVVGADAAGPQGVPGPSGLHIGPTPPSDLTILWVDTS